MYLSIKEERGGEGGGEEGRGEGREGRQGREKVRGGRISTFVPRPTLPGLCGPSCGSGFDDI